jgi:hypothetical protein
MTIVTTYKAFAAAYPSGSRVPIVGPVKRTPKVCLPTKTVTVCAQTTPAVPLVRQNAVRDDVRDDELIRLETMWGTLESWRATEEVAEERSTSPLPMCTIALRESGLKYIAAQAQAQRDMLVRQNAVRDEGVVAEDGVFASKRSIEKEEDERATHESLVSCVVLGKVSGTTAGRGNCKQDRDRIIIGGKLLVVKWEQHNRSYAPATKDPLEISYEECAYLSVGTKKRRHVFMRRGELVGGERGGSYYLDTIRCNV